MRDLREFLDPTRATEWCAAARELSADQAEAALVALAALERALNLRLRAPAPAPRAEALAATDRLLTARQVAEKFGRSVDWVYRRARAEWRSIVVREGRGTVRFPEGKLLRHLASGGSSSGARARPTSYSSARGGPVATRPSPPPPGER
jgi:predicted DNA-binding transcriptional regulator AlpA